jgi:hypothetical protein
MSSFQSHASRHHSFNERIYARVKERHHGSLAHHATDGRVNRRESKIVALVASASPPSHPDA